MKVMVSGRKFIFVFWIFVLTRERVVSQSSDSDADGLTTTELSSSDGVTEEAFDSSTTQVTTSYDDFETTTNDAEAEGEDACSVGK